MTTNEQEALPQGSIKKGKSNRRRRTELLQVRVSPEELTNIVEKASSCSITTAEYLRRLGTGYLPASKLDQFAIRDLCRVAGDLGRLGGLLKLWLSIRRGDYQEIDELIDIGSIDALWTDLQSLMQKLKSKVEEL
jgi:hypothetical protein